MGHVILQAPHLTRQSAQQKVCPWQDWQMYQVLEHDGPHSGVKAEIDAASKAS